MDPWFVKKILERMFPGYKAFICTTASYSEVFRNRPTWHGYIMPVQAESLDDSVATFQFARGPNELIAEISIQMEAICQ